MRPTSTRTARQRLASERGIALPLAMILIVVLLALVATVATAALSANGTSIRERDSRKAFSAADAGITAAVYRLNETTSQSDDTCYTNDPAVTSCNASQVGGRSGLTVAPLGTGTSGLGESVGAGLSATDASRSKFRFYISPAVKGSASIDCAGFQVKAANVSQRCVTSIGTVNGITRRVQARVAGTAGAGSQLPPAMAIVGDTGVLANNNSIVTGDIGCNCQGAVPAFLGNAATAPVTLNNQSRIKKLPDATGGNLWLQLLANDPDGLPNGPAAYPTGQYDFGVGSGIDGIVNGTSVPFTYDPPSFVNYASSDDAAVFGSVSKTWTATSTPQTLGNGATISGTGTVQWTTGSAAVGSWKCPAYCLVMSSGTQSGAVLTLPGGNYYFCGVNVSGGAIRVQSSTTTPVKLYVDSPNRGTSPTQDCGGGTTTQNLEPPTTKSGDGASGAWTGVSTTGATGVTSNICSFLRDGIFSTAQAPSTTAGYVAAATTNKTQTITCSIDAGPAAATTAQLFFYASTASSAHTITASMGSGGAIGNPVTVPAGAGPAWYSTSLYDASAAGKTIDGTKLTASFSTNATSTGQARVYAAFIVLTTTTTPAKGSWYMNKAEFTNPTQDSSMLRVIAWDSDVIAANGLVTSYYSVYAPYSNVEITGNQLASGSYSGTEGRIAAKNIVLDNGVQIKAQNVTFPEVHFNNGPATLYRTAFAQCQSSLALTATSC